MLIEEKLQAIHVISGNVSSPHIQIRARWAGFDQPEPGIQRYEWEQ